MTSSDGSKSEMIYLARYLRKINTIDRITGITAGSVYCCTDSFLEIKAIHSACIVLQK